MDAVDVFYYIPQCVMFALPNVNDRRAGEASSGASPCWAKVQIPILQPTLRDYGLGIGHSGTISPIYRVQEGT